jgi:hypothetical protein
VFSLPLLREIALWLGARDPTPENLMHALLRDDGTCPTPIYVDLEGSRGILAAIETNDTLAQTEKRKKHEGLLHIAYDVKAVVIPVVHRGHRQVFKTYTPYAWMRSAQTFFTDLFGYPFPLLWSMQCRPLHSQVLDSLDSAKYPDVQAFIDAYHSSVGKCAAS